MITHTIVVGDPPRFIVQRVSRIFGPTVHQDIEAVTAHLAKKGLVTPRLIPTDDGQLYTVDPAGEVWRAMNYLPGQTFHRIDSPARAEAAGRLVARFHEALNDFQYDYQHVRLGVHDTPLQMDRLEKSIRTESLETLELARNILSAWKSWKGAPESGLRHAHGDLKLSNLRFSEDGEGLCLLDLDTLGRMSLETEMGDALRSWCNPSGEDSVFAVFDGTIFEAALRGYQQVLPLHLSLIDGILGGVERISLELASRFCRDVWEDCYFGWNPEKFISRAAHNLHRAQGQYHLALSVRQARGN